MGELRYMISEAAKQVDVEAHVLRYWEEELELKIDRTEMGHRYYTRENIELFQCVKKLKEKGMQLKDLKPVIPDLIEKKLIFRQKMGKTDTASKELESIRTVNQGNGQEEADTKQDKKQEVAATMHGEVITDEKLEQVRTFISSVVTDVVTENNEKLKKEITASVTEEVGREMDGLLRAKEMKEEEHFRKMDCLIRQQQALHKESVKSAPIRKLKKIVMGM